MGTVFLNDYQRDIRQDVRKRSTAGYGGVSGVVEIKTQKFNYSET